MEFKDCKELSNAELKLYMNTLNDEFDVLKFKIKNMCDDLTKVDEEYNKAKNELQIRQQNIY